MYSVLTLRVTLKHPSLSDCVSQRIAASHSRRASPLIDRNRPYFAFDTHTSTAPSIAQPNPLLCFHILANSFCRKPRRLILLQTARGVGGAPHASRPRLRHKPNRFTAHLSGAFRTSPQPLRSEAVRRKVGLCYCVRSRARRYFDWATLERGNPLDKNQDRGADS